MRKKKDPKTFHVYGPPELVHVIQTGQNFERKQRLERILTAAVKKKEVMRIIVKVSFAEILGELDFTSAPDYTILKKERTVMDAADFESYIGGLFDEHCNPKTDVLLFYGLLQDRPVRHPDAIERVMATGPLAPRKKKTFESYFPWGRQDMP